MMILTLNLQNNKGSKMNVKPISPDEAVNEKGFPDEVISAFNEMIIENLRGKTSIFKQKDVVKRIIRKITNSKLLDNESNLNNYLYENHWLDIEDLYRAAGWKVEYEKSGYGENYFEAYFKFTKPNIKPTPPETIEYTRGAY